MPTCRVCRPDLYPSGPRQGEHHVAVRFGYPDVLLYVYLDGVRLDNCTEALAGRDGLVVVDWPGEWLWGCPCGSGERPEEIRFGLVEVTNTKREASDERG